MTAPSGTVHPPRGGHVFPFSAIVGQDRMKLALVLNAIDPGIGGVLIRGEKGTAKSTAVRGLARVLPEIPTHVDCPFVCDPERPEEWCPQCRKGFTSPAVCHRPLHVVTLPLNATEDRVIGGLDFSGSLRRGKPVFQPGLLARAHRGILFIDEVNLLDDHLVDVILDAAASGENVVQREGTAFRHKTRFALVGTMNPEEGALRPQLLDRFGLCVEVLSETDPSCRVELMERRESFERDPTEFLRRFSGEEAQLAARIAGARRLLPHVRTGQHIRSFIGELATSHHVAGHRSDLVMERASRAHAAWEGRDRTEMDDVLAVAEMALTHRRRDAVPRPAHSPAPSREAQESSFPENRAASEEPPDHREVSQERSSPSEALQGPEPHPDETFQQQAQEQVFGTGEVFPVKRIAPPLDRLVRRGSGRRTRTRTHHKHGRYIRFRSARTCRDPALDAMLRAAAPFQIRRRGESPMAVVIHPEDWREKVREKRIGSLILFLVDASGSMGVRGRMSASKGAVMSLLLDAYQKRDRVAMVTFRRREASVLLPPTPSIEIAGRLLDEMPVGGRTPLSSGLAAGYELLRQQMRKDPHLRPLAVLVTDGKCNVAMGEGNPMDETLKVAGSIGRDRRVRWIVVDTEEPGIVQFQLARTLASALGGLYFRIDSLRAADLVNIVKGHSP